MKPTWAVVATVDEPNALVAAFVAHHLAQGAATVHVFSISLMQKRRRCCPSCEVTVCDAGYWATSEQRKWPLMHTARQVYARSDVDWLLHCDADEFVRDGATLVTALAEVLPSVPIPKAA